MYYFLNNRLDANSSGIEHAEVKRLKLFKQNGVKAKIVMCEYNRFAHQNLPLYGLTEDDYVNMFDYFAGTVNYTGKPKTIADLQIAPNFRVEKTASGYDVYDGEWQTMAINLFANKQIDTIRYFNGDGNCTKQDFYDTRGFNSLTQIYATGTGNLVYELFFRPNGTIYYEISYEQRPNWLAATNIQLVDREGNLHSLMNLGQAFTIMLDDLNKNDGDTKSTVISDRSNITNVPMINMKTPVRRIEHFHSIHFRDYWDPDSPLTYNSISDNELLSKTDLIVTPGPHQANDMRDRLKTQVPIVAIPVGIVPDEQLQAPQISMSQRKAGKIIAVARLFPEKRLDDTINAFAQVRKHNHQITLDIYGYGNSGDGYKEEKMLKKLVQQLHLQKAIHFMGYTQDMDSVYNNAQLMVMSSRFEGAPLAINEAQSHGVPVISYDTHYGPADLVADGVSGYITPDGDVNALAKKINDYFTNEQLMQKMSTAAYKNAQRFSADNVWQYWKKYVIDAD
ncbi:glycosyltransferase [Lactobacillus sp. ESL0785]|uniref:glycosyltransferase n=1 Tax=Lactobacillus sp. ESL0785 TaxID=2983232 RepID=UPI0023FA1F75|nr:glycosyltransferase [Lactobacillus sp. ESL0785]WEV71424.1 glycosyltransferase [Lactobacillus sp. ESL0785]